MDLSAVLSAYRRYAPTYDLFFGPVFERGRALTAERVNALPPSSVLEVGVGTGLALPRYGADKEITGVDVSPEMLALARRRIVERGLTNVVRLDEMDGENLGFPSQSFDVVVAAYVLSVTPDPHRCLAEMRRVCKPGGRIFICNHFVDRADRWLSQVFEPFSRKLGWRPNFSLDHLLENSRLTLLSTERVPPIGLFKLIVLAR